MNLNRVRLISASGTRTTIWFTITVITLDSNITPTNNAWYYVVAVFDSAVGMKFYVNGTLAASNTITTLGTSNTDHFLVGVDYYTASLRNWPGVIDEVRVSNVARSADWIATEYHNQSNPSLFYTIGSTGGTPILTATPGSSTRIDLNWTASGIPGVAYAILRNGTQIVTGWTSTNYSDTGLAASTAYSYQVQVITYSGPSSLSNIATATTLSTSTPTILAISPLAAAANALVTINGQNFSSPSVTFGGTVATVESWTTNTIVVQVPASLVPSLVNVQVTTASGGSNPVPFMIVLPGCPTN
ncbi:MAG TPA: LamG-like jellyroll fold domain-containing protein [Candidatus Dormibacteraeota bacterium]|nr:LamG-like jellyroll fold domain-containing protein [Candidatus Dormibacteraeota bacterium]